MPAPGRRVRADGLDGRVRVLEGDLREVVWPEGRWQLLASPPYGLTTALLRRLLDDPDRGPERADLILQEEVVRKFAAAPPTTLLGSAWAPWWELTRVERVPRTSFRPVPRVDSAWLRVRRRRPDLLAPGLAPGWAAFLRVAWPPGVAAPARRRGGGRLR